MPKMEESMEWKDKDHGLMKVKTVREIKNNKGEVIGTSEENFQAETRYSQILDGLKVVNERIEQNQRKLDAEKQKLESLGKVPSPTAELIRLRENLETLNKIDQKKQTESKINDLEEQLKNDNEFVVNRTKILDSRPK